MSELQIANLFARRSIRRYTEEPVTEEQITTLLEAAMAAPSAGGRYPWHFVVVTDDAVKKALSEVHEYAKMLLHAPLCIVVCGEPALSIPGREFYWQQDTAAATENILLAATALGLGAVWCGVYPMESRVEGASLALCLPKGIVPFSYVAIGHPAEEREPRTQYDAGRVHRDRW